MRVRYSHLWRGVEQRSTHYRLFTPLRAAITGASRFFRVRGRDVPRMRVRKVLMIALGAVPPATAAAFQEIPVRTTTVLASTDAGALRSVSAVRPLSDGRALVNDGTSKRLILFRCGSKRTPHGG